jgi:hypothetical protein
MVLYDTIFNFGKTMGGLAGFSRFLQTACLAYRRIAHASCVVTIRAGYGIHGAVVSWRCWVWIGSNTFVRERRQCEVSGVNCFDPLDLLIGKILAWIMDGG